MEKGEMVMQPGAFTAALNDEIKQTSNIDSFLERNQELMVKQSLRDHLDFLLMQKGLTIAEVVRGSQMNRPYVYQIFSGEKKPSRDKLAAIAFGMRLSAEETQQMLKLSGNRELYVRDERDALILLALHKNYDIYRANALLYDHNFKILGTPD